MKKLIRIFALTITLILFAIFPQKILAQQYDMNYQGFYNQLSPYGQWIENPEYGYVWIPNEGPNFTPYLSNGYWVLTDYGWMWVSDYNWGWATFHYGRWDYDNYYGWFWVPGNQWAPSWVIWRRSGNYYGWAPMRPGVSINTDFRRYNGEPNDRWIFVRDRDIERHDISRNYIDRRNNITIINNSTVINKTYYDDKRHATYFTGPGKEDVEKNIGRTIKPIKVRERDKPGEILKNDQMQIYRPEIQKSENRNRPVPTKITNIKDLKRISERNTEKQPQNKQILKNKAGENQQPIMNQENRNKSKGITPQNRNTNSSNNNLNKKNQPVVKPVDKKNSKENPNKPPKKDKVDKPKTNSDNEKKKN